MKRKMRPRPQFPGPLPTYLHNTVYVDPRCLTSTPWGHVVLVLLVLAAGLLLGYLNGGF